MGAEPDRSAGGGSTGVPLVQGAEGASRAVSLCALCALLAGCPGPQWTVLADSMDRVALSAWGTAPGEAFVVGGGLGSGAPSMMFQLRSGRWNAVDLATADTMWWVFGFSSSDVYVVGERGAVYRYDGAAARRMTTPTTATLFGIWGASPDDLWAVGGSPWGPGPKDVILHYDGREWSSVPAPEKLDVVFLKIWGSRRDDVFIVGQSGVILHYDGKRWSRQASPLRSQLVTVAGRSSSDVFAVGGPPLAFLHYDGTEWKKEPEVDLASGLGGVAFAPQGDLFVVGLAGVKWRRLPDGKWLNDSNVPPHGDLHAVWVASDGSALAAGGNYLVAEAGAPRKGLVAYFGTRPPPQLP